MTHKGGAVDEMSSEQLRNLLTDDQPATAGGPPLLPRADARAPALGSSGRNAGSTLVADAPTPVLARWQPGNWRLRTKLIALTGLPLGLAAVLGALRVAASAHHSHSAAMRDAVIIGAALLLTVVLLPLLVRSILEPARELRESADAVHGEAVRLANEQAVLRANVSDMFVNLSRRNQSLVERQLRLIDDLELGEQDSDRLGALFRLDHLATRMRRNGENLLVLAGAELQQRSGQPVPIIDVLRAAVSEIEDYRRVVMQPLPRAQVSGLAVNDIVHLVAELLDNATAYSDPETQVQLNAALPPGGGLVIEISDAGTGLPRARVAEINDRLAAPPAVDVSVSRQMGLYVVGRLAERHNVRVQLTSDDSAGVTVTVSLPPELVTGPEPGAPEFASAPLPRLDALDSFGPFDNSINGGPVNGGSPALTPPTFADLPVLSQPTAYSPELLDEIRGDAEDDAATPIFQAMLSRWFTEDDPVLSGPDPATPATAPADPWRSDADAGWQAAEAAHSASTYEITAAGLPKRQPQAFLVPGSVDTPAPNGTPRSAEAARDRLSSFQRGLTRGRHEATNANGSSTNGAGPVAPTSEHDNGHYLDNDNDHEFKHVWEAHR